MRREKRELSKDVPALEGGTEYEITDKVVSLQLRYSSDGTTWYDDWDSKAKSYPKLVEIGLRLKGDATYTMRVDVFRSL